MMTLLIPTLLRLGLSARLSKLLAAALPFLLVAALVWFTASQWHSRTRTQLKNAVHQGQLQERLEQNNEVFKQVEAAHRADAVVDPVRDQRLCEKYDRNCKIGE